MAEKKGVKFTAAAVFEATGKGEGVKSLLRLIAEHALLRTDRDVSTEGKTQVFKAMFIREATQHLSIMMAHCNAIWWKRQRCSQFVEIGRDFILREC